MKTIFADTGYWIALLDPQDTLHKKAINLSIALAQERICTSEMAFTEVLNHFAKRGNFLRQAAATLIESAQDNPAVFECKTGTIDLRTRNFGFPAPTLVINGAEVEGYSAKLNG